MDNFSVSVTIFPKNWTCYQADIYINMDYPCTLWRESLTDIDIGIHEFVNRTIARLNKSNG